jgi:hypothetical protein
MPAVSGPRHTVDPYISNKKKDKNNIETFMIAKECILDLETIFV